MLSKTAVAITALLAAAEAVKVTKPAKGDEWDLSETNEITWESVSTDPKSFEIVIINQSSFPETSETIATVNTADGKYELKGANVAAGNAYRINFVSTDAQNSGILAQSQEFSLVADDSDDNTASASASATPSASASASVSASGSVSATASASATGASSSGSATVSVTSNASGLTTVTTGTASASASGTDASASGTASATGSAASATATSAPSSASAVKSTVAIFGSVALAVYMLF